ncbi:phosphatase PAP2 family protein [Enhygromyxa salina]|uniref:phosphatase PAP2 family protein n=1 Tax=Enhygromyxa salina TaxID=215803 RepID=UPI0015E5D18E|nr:phosphatase PAP2 family protein [Enhygromyxa salina]
MTVQSFVVAAVLAQAPTGSSEGPDEAPNEEPVADLEPVHPANARWAVDGPIALGSLAVGFTMQLWVTKQLPLDPLPTRPALGGFDRSVHARYSKRASLGAEVLQISGGLLPFLVHTIEAAPHRGRVLARLSRDFLIYEEAAGLTLLTGEIIKYAARRPRPLAYANPDDYSGAEREALIEAQADPASRQSFVSSHTALMVAAAVASSTLLTIKLRGRGTKGAKAAIALTWIGASGIAVGTAALVLVGGQAYPSDVIAGASLGAAFGAAVPLAHLRPKKPGRATVRLGPLYGPTRGAAIMGRF